MFNHLNFIIMTKFNLQGLGTPNNGASYDNESAYRELLSRVNNGESITASVYTDRDNYPAFGIETKKVARFKVRVNQSLLNLLIGYLNNGTMDESAVKANEVEPYEEGKDFTTDLFKLLIDAGSTPQIVPLFRAAYGNVNAVFNFPNGRMYFRLERTDELLDYLADKKLL